MSIAPYTDPPTITPPYRRFHLGDVLSLTTGVLLSPRGWAGLGALVAHLCGRPIPLTALHHIDVADESQVVEGLDQALRAHLLRAHPALATYTADEVPEGEFTGLWLRRRIREHGRYLAVPPLPPVHAWSDLIATLPYVEGWAAPLVGLPDLVRTPRDDGRRERVPFLDT